MLDEVNMNPLPPFGAGMGGHEDDGGDKGEEADEGEEDGGDEGVVEVEADGNRKKRRANNYAEIEDATLCRALAAVGMDVVFDTDQTGKRYWQRIEDKFHKLMPRVCNPVDRTYRSLQGRWDDRIADARYRDMAGSKGKRFTMRHCFDVLQHLPKWKLRDEEVALEKAAMVALDDTEDEKEGRNAEKPEGKRRPRRGSSSRGRLHC
ncbi:hypothetical protein QYE76_027786 [Lolium multiflorum]|uniref:Uncharacterized protein n=1 Tax=Lolium multiflorum TaxID=4521 RepID=A0AAD8VGF2_LOLMU|nr:hypothetical protein QYE76_027786 [Lolium multiflorum]